MSLPTNFWSFTLGNIITVVITVLTVSFGFGKIYAKIDDLTNWRGTIEQKINHMDVTGTSAAVARNQIEDLRNAEQDRRIAQMESTLQQVVPDVREIKTKLDLVAQYLEEARDGKKLKP